MECIVYKTTNTINGRYYVGVTNDSTKDYLGSGKALRLAVRKYGKDKFIRETLFSCDNEPEAYAKEAEIVNADFIQREETYNIKEGGYGWPGMKHTEETKKKMSEKAKKRTGENNTFYGKKHSAESKEKMRLAKIGVTPINKGVPWSKDIKKKMSESAKNRPVVECPHCHKTCQINMAKRWHFDKCRDKS
jgi:group I intron endonuclease